MNPHPASDSHGEHDRLRDLLGAHALGQLEGDEAAEVDAHLAACDECRHEHAALLPLVGPLSRVDPDATDPDPSGPTDAGLAAILRRVHDEQALDAPTVTTPGATPRGAAVRRLVTTSVRPATPAHGMPLSTHPDATVPEAPSTVVPPARRRRVVPRLLAAAAVVVAFGIGVVSADLGPTLLSAEPEPTPVVVQALAPGIAAGAGTIDHTWGVEVVLTGTGFVPGRTYDVAVLGRDGRTVGAGAFVGTGDTEMVCRLNASILRQQSEGFVVTDVTGVEVLRSRFT